MFLKLLSFRKKTQQSPASRNFFYFHLKLNYPTKHKRLTFFKKNESGRGATGRIIIRTKTSVLIKRRNVLINYNLNYTKVGFIGGFVFLPYKNRLLSLIYYSNGAVSYFLSTRNHKIFSSLIFLFNKKIKGLKFKKLFSIIFRIKKLSYISCLSIKPAAPAQYVRSPGCKSRLFKFDKEKHSVLMDMPSKKKKLFSYYSFAFLGAMSNYKNKKFSTGKAGY